MSDRIHLPRLRAALGRHYGIAPKLACTQQVDDTVPRTQTLAWDCDHQSVLRIVPSEIWNRCPNRYSTRELIDDVDNHWYVTAHGDGAHHITVHTCLEGDRKSTKKAEQQAARAAARICKMLQSLRAAS